MKKIQCTTEEVYRNKKTNVVYASKKDAQQDVSNSNTDTKQEDIAIDVKVIVPPEALSLISDTKK
jgi:hypothetical protein|tara:strand:- start:250 stop:444 length:195 start_codon:yes stop_codon:yes gene_type:complete